MSYSAILFSHQAGIARITLNRPEKLNSFTRVMLLELHAAIARTRAENARVLVISGTGRGFCAGQDLGESALDGGNPNIDSERAIDELYKPLILGLQALDIPVIGAINGIAAGAGASLALACDLVIAARSACFLQAFGRIGLIPDAGGTWFLPRLVGNARAMGHAMLGERLPAAQAEAWGMIWKCVDDDKFGDEVEAMARHFSRAPTRAMGRTKRAILSAGNNTLAEQIALEGRYQGELDRSRDVLEGVTAFLQKRAPVFVGE